MILFLKTFISCHYDILGGISVLLMCHVYIGYLLIYFMMLIYTWYFGVTREMLNPAY
jgi:hypothetical protein